MKLDAVIRFISSSTHKNAAVSINVDILTPRFQHFSGSDRNRIFRVQIISTVISNSVFYCCSWTSSWPCVSACVAVPLLSMETKYNWR